MTQKIAELRERIANLQAMGTRSAGNARLVHDQYWRALTRLWVGVTEGNRRKHLIRFLHACSQPLFPQMTEQELEQRLARFIKNFFHSKRSRPPRRA
jgi:hypothetical protein